jgi:hypothetical protein
VGADIALEGELTRDDFFDGDLLVPAIAAVFFLASRFGHLFGAAQRTTNVGYRPSGHPEIVT